jgi:hypothetical protein
MAEMNDDPLNSLDHELSVLAAVQPSPEFGAKVRSRIQAEDPPRFAWRWLAVGSAVAAVILVFAVFRMTDHDSLGKTPPKIHADVTLRAPSVVEPPRVRVSQTVRRPSARIVRQTKSSEPELLIDPSLAAAVRRLATERPTLPEVPPERSLDPVFVGPLNVPEVSEIGSVRPQADQGRR